MKNVEKSIRLAPFTPKYKEYLIKAETHEINCLEGSIRSGKTITNIIAFAHYIDNHATGGIFVVSSTTSGIAYEIIAEARGHNSADGKYGAEQGFGLLYLFKGRVKRTKIKGSVALEITNKKGKKCDIIFVGAKNKGSTESVRGLTICGWLATELENHICIDGDDFIGFMFGRLLGSPNMRIFLDLNPVYPAARMYTQYLDKFESNPDISYNYLKCNLTDNPAFTQEQIDNILRLYADKNSVLYKRDILGNRASSSGIIFTGFGNNKDNFIVNDLSVIKGNLFKSVGIDFGGNGSNTGFCCSILSRDGKQLIPIADDKIDMSNQENATVGVYRSRLESFINKAKSVRPDIPILYTFCDSADPVMVNETRIVLKRVAPNIQVGGCDKWTIKDRIRLLSAMLYSGHCKIYKDCTYLIDSLQTQVWNTKEGHEDERLDDGSCDIDIADSFEYSWTKFHVLLNKANTL